MVAPKGKLNWGGERTQEVTKIYLPSGKNDKRNPYDFSPGSGIVVILYENNRISSGGKWEGERPRKYAW